LDFLDLICVLPLFGFLVLLGLFIAKLAIINQAADGRVRIRGDLNEVDPLCARQIKGFLQREHSVLMPVGANNTHFAGTDLAVYASVRTARRLRTRGKRATQAALTG
jgi:hypothetical protein